MIRCLPTLLILGLVLLMVVTSSMAATLSEGKDIDNDVDIECVLCRSKCDHEDCVRKNTCIRGRGNACRRFDPADYGAAARNCVARSEVKLSSCLRGNCERRCFDA